MAHRLALFVLPLVACTELTDGATQQVFVDAAVALDRAPEGPLRDRVRAMTDGGWLRADTVSIQRASAFKAAVDRALADDALSEEEVAALETLAEGFGADWASAHDGELLAKRQAEEQARRVAPVRTAFDLDVSGVLPRAERLAERGETLSWTTRTCARQRETAYRSETCHFHHDDERIVVTLTQFTDLGDARLAERPGPWERGSTAFREGTRVLKARSTDREAAEALGLSVYEAFDDDARQTPVDLPAFQALLVEQGWQLGPCREDRDERSAARACDVHREGAGGFVSMSWRLGEVVGGPVTATYLASTAELARGGLTVRARLSTTKSAALRLASLRGASADGSGL